MRIRIAAALATAAAISLGSLVFAAPAQAAFRNDIEIDLADGKCLDVPEGNFASGVLVQEWSCNGSIAQRWNFVWSTSHYFQIQSVGNPSLCLNNWSGGGAKGDAIALYSCASGDSLFNTVGTWNGYFQFQPKAAVTTCVMPWGGTAQGAKLRLDTCSTGGEKSYFDLHAQVSSEN
ncbi:RICIN domain-containing protein [Streptomyces sp. NPDC093249]|uniref:RICIN domain-containing protein n=1 Tax=unclassified Streptomyces TaxID=2593676 RepID=UPI00344BFE35